MHWRTFNEGWARKEVKMFGAPVVARQHELTRSRLFQCSAGIGQRSVSGNLKTDGVLKGDARGVSIARAT
jgi:hypothetical protein